MFLKKKGFVMILVHYLVDYAGCHLHNMDKWYLHNMHKW